MLNSSQFVCFVSVFSIHYLLSFTITIGKLCMFYNTSAIF